MSTRRSSAASSGGPGRAPSIARREQRTGGQRSSSGESLRVAIGVDVVELTEFDAAIAQRPAMLARVFTARELAYCRARPRPLEHLAARFAAKEAAFKAVGTGWAKGVRWRDAEVLSSAGEPPALRVRGALLRYARALGPGWFAVSVSHSGAYAVAMVVYCTSAR